MATLENARMSTLRDKQLAQAEKEAEEKKVKPKVEKKLKGKKIK